MSDLRRTIARLADDFAANIVKALHGALLSDLAVLGTKTNGRTPRAVTNGRKRTPKSLAREGRRLADEGMVAAIVDALQVHPKGMRNEQLQQVLVVSKNDMTRPLKAALAAKAIKKKGQRRATTYFAV